MKNTIIAGLICGMLLSISACSTVEDSAISVKNHFDPNISNPDLVNEHWSDQLKFDTDKWVRGADSWYFSGTPNAIEQANDHATTDQAISTINVAAGNFTHLVLDGTFQVQIVGGQEKNSVYIVGPNAETQQILARVQRHTLTIQQQTDYSGLNNTHDLENLLGIDPTPAKHVLNHVLVRIGIKQLSGLTTRGWIKIEGKQIVSSNLAISSSDHTQTILSGDINITKILAKNASNLTILGIYTPTLTINASGSSNINLAGRIDIQRINKTGSGRLNIKGANSNNLSINNSGSGTIAILGNINLKDLAVEDNSNTYIADITSKSVSINAKDQASVGLMGQAYEANVNLGQSSRLDAHHFNVSNLYIKTVGDAHANVSATSKIFASSFNRSSIYFFGAENILTPYIRDSSTILAIDSKK